MVTGEQPCNGYKIPLNIKTDHQSLRPALYRRLAHSQLAGQFMARPVRASVVRFCCIRRATRTCTAGIAVRGSAALMPSFQSGQPILLEACSPTSDAGGTAHGSCCSKNASHRQPVGAYHSKGDRRSDRNLSQSCQRGLRRAQFVIGLDISRAIALIRMAFCVLLVLVSRREFLRARASESCPRRATPKHRENAQN
jgi:hypothetical protein